MPNYNKILFDKIQDQQKEIIAKENNVFLLEQTIILLQKSLGDCPTVNDLERELEYYREELIKAEIELEDLEEEDPKQLAMDDRWERYKND